MKTRQLAKTGAALVLMVFAVVSSGGYSRQAEVKDRAADDVADRRFKAIQRGEIVVDATAQNIARAKAQIKAKEKTPIKGVVKAEVTAVKATPRFANKAAKGGDLADQVREAIQGGIKYLRAQQLADGSWEVDHISSFRAGGWTSLSMLALLDAGVSAEDKMMQKGLKYLRQVEVKHTYVKALQTMVFAKAGQRVDKERIQKNVDWLIKHRVMDGGRLLGWTYTASRRLPDNSNTEYAVLALHAGHRAGATIPKEIWNEIREFYLHSQLRDGGYAYNRGIPEHGSLTMDTAGLCGLIISGLALNSTRELNSGDGTFKDCGFYEDSSKLQNTVRLIGRRFTVKLERSIYYNLHGIERAGRLSGMRFMGSRDWYREGCKFLVREQAAGGEWPKRGDVFDQWPVINTSFALLFLANGRTPVLISKMVHGNLGRRYDRLADWNRDRHDAKHLTDFASKQLFKNQPLAWQVFDGHQGFGGRDENNDADRLVGLTSELLQSPIVYFNGHEAPEFKDVEIDLLRKYVENGGFILAEACCGRERFHKGFTEETVKKLFPDNKLEPLGEGHPVWTAFFKVAANKPFKLMGIQRGGKTALIYSPQDLSCYWESNKVNDKDPNYLLAFRLGANIVAYATALKMPDVRLKAKPVAGKQKEKPDKRGPADEAEKRAVDAIHEMRGKIIRDQKAQNKPIVEVNLFGTKVTDEALRHLAGLYQLQTLDLSLTKLKDAGLKHVAGLERLRTLDLGDTKITDAGLKHLVGLKRLRTLGLASTRVTDVGLNGLAGLTRLQILNLHNTKVTDAGMKALAGLKYLQTLSVGATDVTDAGVKELAALKQLQALDLGGTDVTDAGLRELNGLKQLNTLELDYAKLTDAGLKHVAGHKQLHTLSLDNTKVTDVGLKHLAALNQLETLNLAITEVTDAGLKDLAGLKRLKTLKLCYANVTDAGLKELARLKQLRYLDLSFTKVTDAGLKELARLKQLNTLDLVHTKVTDVGLKELAGLNHLETLDLRDTKVTEAGQAELQKALPKVRILR